MQAATEKARSALHDAVMAETEALRAYMRAFCEAGESVTPDVRAASDAYQAARAMTEAAALSYAAGWQLAALQARQVSADERRLSPAQGAA